MSIDSKQPQQPAKPTQPKPEQPTMTTTSLMPPTPEVINPYKVAEELSPDIIAGPLVMPDFINIKLRNKELSKRWINYKAGDGLRFQQALAQGWRVATKTDVAEGYITPYLREGGTKYINGDLILMVIARSKYLGALKLKHQVAAALADASITRAVSKRRADTDLAARGGASRANYDPKTGQPKVSFFTPDEADLTGTPFASSMKEGLAQLDRLGRDAGPDMGGANVPSLDDRLDQT